MPENEPQPVQGLLDNKIITGVGYVCKALGLLIVDKQPTDAWSNLMLGLAQFHLEEEIIKAVQGTQPPVPKGAPPK